jgi:hypothetical protein
MVFLPDVIFRDKTNKNSVQGLIYYDLLMWCFRQLSENVVDGNQEKIRKAFEEVCKSSEFKKTKTGGLQKKDYILLRRKLLRDSLGLF